MNAPYLHLELLNEKWIDFNTPENKVLSANNLSQKMRTSFIFLLTRRQWTDLI